MVNMSTIIVGALAIIFGLIMLPLIALFISSAKTGNTSGQGDTPVANISGLSAVLDLIAYGFAFGLVGLGVGMIFIGFKED